MANEAKEEPHIKLVETELAITPGNPFANLDALRNPQDYDEFLGGEAVTAFAVRTLKEAFTCVSIRTRHTVCSACTRSPPGRASTSSTRNFAMPWGHCLAAAICISPSMVMANISCCW